MSGRPESWAASTTPAPSRREGHAIHQSRGTRVNKRSFITVPATLLAVAAIAATPVWASDDDDDDGETPTAQPAPFVQAPAPAPIAAPAPATPAVPGTSPSTPSTPSTPTAAPAREKQRPAATRKRTLKKAIPHKTVAAHRVSRARSRAAALRTAPRGGVQAGAGGMARTR